MNVIRTDRSGIAVPLVIAFMLLGGLGALAAASTALQQTRDSGSMRAAIYAIQAAESGASFVVNRFASGKLGWPAGDTIYEGTEVQSFSEDLPSGYPGEKHGAAGWWWVDAMEFQGNTVTLQMTGSDAMRRAERRIEIVYDRGGPQPLFPFDHAVVGCSGVTFAGSGAVDSYNSNHGPYQSWNAGTDGDVGTISGDVKLPGNTQIAGDLWVGGDIEFGGSAGVSGTIRATGDIDFPFQFQSRMILGYIYSVTRRPRQHTDSMLRPDGIPVLNAFGVMPHAVTIDNTTPG